VLQRRSVTGAAGGSETAESTSRETPFHVMLNRHGVKRQIAERSEQFLTGGKLPLKGKLIAIPHVAPQGP
jgi:hypothetical protein